MIETIAFVLWLTFHCVVLLVITLAPLAAFGPSGAVLSFLLLAAYVLWPRPRRKM